ncbi:uncharacterized protein VTP21DRAFT_1699 [Calcarisporiella thermophila]|uniref:uncharacterized protein n=1 Tax=Calcarisporiella thermophila TaxID=911321 RepID=UPI003742B19A
MSTPADIASLSKILQPSQEGELDQFIRDSFAKGIDLREYAQQIERDLSTIEKEHEDDYVRQTENFVLLHQQIESCDSILETMENMLSTFQSDLGKISAEIQTLQDRSSSMAIKLKNRKGVEDKLSEVLDGLVVPPYMIKKIFESDIDDVWIAYLTEIDKKMGYVKSNRDKSIRALRDVGPKLEKLRLKAADKIREFLLNKIRSLRIPNTNVQIIQQSILHKHKPLFGFLMERHREAAAEVRQTYVNTMRWYYFNHFERYLRGLQKLQLTIADKNHLIGQEEGGMLAGPFVSKLALKDKSNVFALGDRSEILKNPENNIVLIHIAEQNNQKYPYEALFRSFNLTMIDNASTEYLFLVEFFSRDEKSATEIAKSAFIDIFEPTQKMGLNATKQFVETSHDAVGILLCIRINMQLSLELQRRRVPALESYTNATNMLLWPRFQLIMNKHIESVKKAVSKISAKDTHPHYITRRFAEFAASLLVLNDDYNDAILIQSLQRLRNEVDALLNKISAEFSDRKNSLIFLINNYDLVITVLTGAGGKSVEPEIDHFRTLLTGRINAYTEEELAPHFGDLIKLVKQAEQDKEKEYSAQSLEQVALSFNNNWRQALSIINSSVIRNFSNFKNGTTVLHAVLGQLIVYYTRFHVILEERAARRGKDGPPGYGFRRQPVGVQTVMVEIKKFRSNF